MKEASSVAASQLDKMTEAALQHCGISSAAEASALIGEVLAIAHQWASGMMPLSEVRRLTRPQERYLAARVVKPQPPVLSALLDALIAENTAGSGGYAYNTVYGTFTSDDLTAAKAKMDRVDGQVRIRFPQRQPWARYPDEEGITQQDRDGQRGEPFYANDQEERIRIAEEFAQKRMGAGPSKRRTITRRKPTDEVPF